MQLAGVLVAAVVPLLLAAAISYNRFVNPQPSNLIASMTGFERREYFELDPAIRDGEPPRVET